MTSEYQINRKKPAEEKPHGTRARYQAGCRCLLCRAANARYALERMHARAAGDRNGLVPANAARQHILLLAKKGVGRSAVSAASDVAPSVISRIKSGENTLIRKRTEDRILAVSSDALSDEALVRAGATWRQINSLLKEGFTKAELARRLGYQRGWLQLGKDRIRARNAMRVDRLYRLLMKE